MKKIAILRRNGFGDLLCAFPLILFLKNKNWDVTLFAEERNAPILPYLPSLHEVHILPSRGNKYWNHFSCALKHRKKFDVALSAKTSPMKLANFFLYGLGAKERYAYVDKSWHSKLINCAINYNPTEKLHQALKNLRLIEPHFKEIPEELYPRMQVSQSLPRISNLPTVLICATTTRNENRLPIEKYASLLNKLHDHSPIQVLLLSEPKDSKRALAISQQLKAPCHMHFPRNFDDFVLWLNVGDLYFIGDGGIAHMGAALRKKEVILYGGTNPLEWAPLTKEAAILYHPVHTDCINDQDILAALKNKLEEVIRGRKNI